MITLKSPREIETMAAAGRIVAGTLALVQRHVRPGVSTEELDRLAEDFIRSHPGARPSLKGLYEFPATLCTSINAEVGHGIPSGKRTLGARDRLLLPRGAPSAELRQDEARRAADAQHDDRHRAYGERRGSRYPDARRQVDGRHAGRVARGTLRAHGSGAGRRRAAPHPHDGGLTSLQWRSVPHRYDARASRSSASASSSSARPAPGSESAATFTRTFSTAPASAAPARAAATLASECAFWLPIAPISRASANSRTAPRAICSGVCAAPTNA